MTEDSVAEASTHLANQMRRIIERLAVVRPVASELGRAAEAAAAFADHLDTLAERERSWEVSEAGLLPGDFVAYSPVSGASNAIAPPVVFTKIDAEGGPSIEGEVTFGPAYEGPPGHVHGGIVAAMFDELLGFAQLSPGFTGTLTIRYRKPTPLNRRLSLAARVERVDGRKRWVRGTCELDGILLAEAEGLFIAPRSDEDYLAYLAPA
ncbi:MAG TPA: PaaI family thioesterase [Acidimicrobiales bacterium]|jgi:acyl-coenzyme A thioesterase PaaI-like protein|nr:PaaI family thioesterase [Acidimicrobiales bacterium]